MTIARRKQVCLDVTPYYHCISNCVRQSYLCGYDKHTRKNYDHRRDWIEERLLLLSTVYCIDVAGFAVLSNHYHLVLHVNSNAAETLSDDEVIDRWLELYKGTVLINKFRDGVSLSSSEDKLVQTTIATWRDQLTNLSRFMANLNEHIARRANKEDGCRGRFWEGRFKSQAVLDLPALIRTLCYVDLNPLRAKMATTPEACSHTSLHRRIHQKSEGLMPFEGEIEGGKHPQTVIIPLAYTDYLNLVDWTGRQIRSDKRGAISESTPPILERLGLLSAHWVSAINPTVGWQQRAIGSADRIKQYCKAIGQRWLWQMPEVKNLWLPPSDHPASNRNAHAQESETDPPVL